MFFEVCYKMFRNFYILIHLCIQNVRIINKFSEYYSLNKRNGGKGKEVEEKSRENVLKN